MLLGRKRQELHVIPYMCNLKASNSQKQKENVVAQGWGEAGGQWGEAGKACKLSAVGWIRSQDLREKQVTIINNTMIGLKLHNKRAEFKCFYKNNNNELTRWGDGCGNLSTMYTFIKSPQCTPWISYNFSFQLYLNKTERNLYAFLICASHAISSNLHCGRHLTLRGGNVGGEAVCAVEEKQGWGVTETKVSPSPCSKARIYTNWSTHGTRCYQPVAPLSVLPVWWEGPLFLNRVSTKASNRMELTG